MLVGFGIAASASLAVILGGSLADVVPWDIATYALASGPTMEVRRALLIGVAAPVGGVLAFVLLRTPAVDLGRARFATVLEVGRAGLFARSGILLGRLGGSYLRSADPVHVLVAAPTRSGKGVGIVVPNLLSWPGSAVVLDIKYENFEITSGFRAVHGQAVYRFSPADGEGRSHRYNPLDSVSRDAARRISDIQRLAAILLPVPPGGRDAFWQEEARSLFLGLALYVLDTPGVPGTLGEIYRTLSAGLLASDGSGRYSGELYEGLEQVLFEDGDLDPACRVALAGFVQKAEKERSGVRSTLAAALNLFANPMIDRATSCSDFDLAALRRKPMTIYVAVSPGQLPAVARLLNLFFQQAIALLSERLPGPDEPHTVLMMLDEFTSVGRMDILKEGLAHLAGYGVRVCAIVQGLGQLEDSYGPGARESMLQNSAMQVFYAANDESTARYVSQRLGTQTIRTVTDQPARGRTLRSRSFSHTTRALMLPEEVRELGPEEAVVLREGARPVRARKIRYYAERALAERVLPSSPVPRLVAAGYVPVPGLTEAGCPPQLGLADGAGPAPRAPAWGESGSRVLEDEIEAILGEHEALVTRARRRGARVKDARDEG